MRFPSVIALCAILFIALLASNTDASHSTKPQMPKHNGMADPFRVRRYASDSAAPGQEPGSEGEGEGDEKKCPGTSGITKVAVLEAPKIADAPFLVALFWLVLWGCVLLFIVTILQRNAELRDKAEKEHAEDETCLVKTCWERLTPSIVVKWNRNLFGRFKIYDTVADLTQGALFITQAVLLYKLMLQIFECIYLSGSGKGNNKEEESCAELNRFGNMACTFGEEEEELEWAVLLPTFYFALLVLFIYFLAAAKCCSRFWTEFTSGYSGHILGFILLAIIDKQIGKTKFFDIYERPNDVLDGAGAVVSPGFLLYNKNGENVNPELKENQKAPLKYRPENEYNMAFDANFADGSAAELYGGWQYFVENSYDYLATGEDSDGISIPECLNGKDPVWGMAWNPTTNKYCYPSRTLTPMDVGGYEVPKASGADPYFSAKSNWTWNYFEGLIANISKEERSTCGYLDASSTYHFNPNSTCGGNMKALIEDANTKNPFCTLVNGHPMCYVPASYQMVKPFYWFKENIFGSHLGELIGNLLAYGLMTLAIMLACRLILNLIVSCCVKKETMTKQQKIDRDEFDDGVNDVLCDLVGNTMGKLISRIVYWLMVGIMLIIQPYSYNSQYQLDSPIVLLVIMAVISRAGISLVTTIQHYGDEKIKDFKGTWTSWFYWNFLSGLREPTTNFLFAYFIFDAFKLFSWALVASNLQKEMSICARGITAFTPLWGEEENIDNIIQSSPVSPLGTCFLFCFLSTLIIIRSKYDLDSKANQKNLLVSMHQHLSANDDEEKDFTEHKKFLEDTWWSHQWHEIKCEAETKIYGVLCGLSFEVFISCIILYLSSCEYMTNSKQYHTTEDCESASRMEKAEVLLVLKSCFTFGVCFGHHFANWVLIKTGLIETEKADEDFDHSEEDERRAAPGAMPWAKRTANDSDVGVVSAVTTPAVEMNPAGARGGDLEKQEEFDHDEAYDGPEDPDAAEEKNKNEGSV